MNSSRPSAARSSRTRHLAAGWRWLASRTWCQERRGSGGHRDAGLPCGSGGAKSGMTQGTAQEGLQWVFPRRSPKLLQISGPGRHLMWECKSCPDLLASVSLAPASPNQKWPRSCPKAAPTTAFSQFCSEKNSCRGKHGGPGDSALASVVFWDP